MFSHKQRQGTSSISHNWGTLETPSPELPKPHICPKGFVVTSECNTAGPLTWSEMDKAWDSKGWESITSMSEIPNPSHGKTGRRVSSSYICSMCEDKKQLGNGAQRRSEVHFSAQESYEITGMRWKLCHACSGCFFVGFVLIKLITHYVAQKIFHPGNNWTPDPSTNNICVLHLYSAFLLSQNSWQVSSLLRHWPDLDLLSQIQ